MSEIAVKQAAPNFLTSGLERLKRQKSPTVDAEKVRLKKATKEFQAFFMYQMLKTMRETIPENPLVKDSPFSQGSGKDMFTQMFDMEIARKISVGRESSIADILYSSLEKLVENEFRDKPEVRPAIKQLPVEKPEFRLLGKQSKPINKPKPATLLEKGAPDFLNLVGRMNTTNAQNVSKKPKAP